MDTRRTSRKWPQGFVISILTSIESINQGEWRSSLRIVQIDCQRMPR